MSDFRTVRGLTPMEVTECIVKGIPLQYQTDSSTKWVDLHSDGMQVSFYVPYTYRQKPSTVQLSGTEVVQPVLDNMFPYSREVYTLSEGFNRVVKVVPKYVADAKLYWSTHEDAQVALETIRAVLRGE